MMAKYLFLGNPKSYQWEGQEFITSIFRDTVSSLEIKEKVIENNSQANYKYHGGRFKELYSYAVEDYLFWKSKLSDSQYSMGMMGENITTEGLNEDQLFIGDNFRVGSVILEVSQPRLPCSKLNLRLMSKDAIKLFLESKKYGVYYKIIQDGKINEGDKISYIGRDPKLPMIKLAELAPVLLKRKVSIDLVTRILNFPDIDPAITTLAQATSKVE